jgi:hypothetical protein
MLFEVMDLVAEERCQTPETRCEKERRELEELQRMTDSLLRRDVPSALIAVGGVAALRLVQANADTTSFQRQMKYVGAMSSYLNSYHGVGINGQPFGPDEQRRLRRQSINALVDLASDRSQKLHEFTWALTVTPGVRGFLVQRGPSSLRDPIPVSDENPKPDNNWLDPGMHLSLPLGVTGEYVLGQHTGLTLNAFAIDLGQYTATQFNSQARLAEPEVWSALAPGVGVGFTFHNWNFMLDSRYAPGWNVKGSRYPLCTSDDDCPSGDTRKRVDATFTNTWTFGLTIGYQVSLLRFD